MSLNSIVVRQFCCLVYEDARTIHPSRLHNSRPTDRRSHSFCILKVPASCILRCKMKGYTRFETAETTALFLATNVRYFYPFLFALSEHVHISCIPGVSYSISIGISHSTSYSISYSVGISYSTSGISGLEFHAAFLSFLVFFRDPVQVLALEASTH